MRRVRSAPLATLLVFGLTAPGHAEPTLTAAFPNGAPSGATVKLRLSGAELPSPGTLLIEGAGVEAAGPFVNGEGTVRIAPDAATGPRLLRLVGERSATPPRPFAVGSLPEVLEQEPNDTPQQAQPLAALPVTLNGTLPTRGDVDTFRVSLRRGACLVVAGASRALGAPTNLLVRVRDARGRELASQMDSRTRDPLLAYTAGEDGDYVVELLEVMNNYSNIDGTYVYRVTLTTGPWLDRASPPGARRGATARLWLSGWNLEDRPGRGATLREVEIPEAAGERHEVRVPGVPNSVFLAVGEYPERGEGELSDAGTGGGPPLLDVPVTVNGVLGARGEVDRYRIAARAADTVRVAVQARALGSLADPRLEVRDLRGTVLEESDDGNGGRDPALTWRPPADGTYLLGVGDIARRGGEGFYYRLTVAPPAPVLQARTSHQVILARGGSADLVVKVRRSGFSGPVRVSVHAAALPVGISVQNATCPPGEGDAEVRLRFSASGEAAPGASTFHVRAEGAVPGGVRTTVARAAWVLATDRSGTLAEGETEQLLLLVTPSAPAAAP